MSVSAPTQPTQQKTTRKKANSVPPPPGTALVATAHGNDAGASGSQSQPLTPIRLPSIHFDITPEQITKFKAKAATIKFDSTAEYERGRVFLGELRTTRTSVDKRRKELKAEPLKYLEQVEEEAQTLMGGIKAIETPLLQAKQVIDDEEALERVRKANVERERIEAEEREKLRIQQEAIRKQQEEWAEYRDEEEARIKKEKEKLEESKRLLEAKEQEVAAKQAEAKQVEAKQTTVIKQVVLTPGSATERAGATGRGRGGTPSRYQSRCYHCS